MLTLDHLALRHRTDKSSAHHNYCPVYERYFSKWRNEHFTLLEIGCGGYQYSNRGGESLRMWCEYFPQATCATIDIYDKSEVARPKNGQIYQCSQTDDEGLKNLLAGRKPRIIIDDGSHNSKHTITSFEILFPYLENGGIYVVEDTEASYWANEEFEGTAITHDLREISTMNYFKLLCDCLNYKHIPSYTLFEQFRDKIDSISFHRQMIFITKA